MRTRAEATTTRTARGGETAAPRRARGPRPAPASGAPPAPARQPEAPSVAVTAVRMLRVEEGLYALRVGEIAGEARDIAGMAVPVAQVSTPFAEDGGGVEIVAAFPRRGPWLDKSGGTLVLRSPNGGGHVLVTVYGGAEQPANALSLDLRRLDEPERSAETGAPTAAAAAAAPAVPAGEGREVPTEILLH